MNNDIMNKINAVMPEVKKHQVAEDLLGQRIDDYIDDIRTLMGRVEDRLIDMSHRQANIEQLYCVQYLHNKVVEMVKMTEIQTPMWRE